MRRTRLRRVGKNKKKNDKKKRETKAELAKKYGVRMTYWRYNGLKGIYWNLLSQYVRKRDVARWGTCISCGRRFKDWHDAQAGHYAPAKDCGFILLFDKRNIHAECSTCNNPFISPGKLIKYRLNLVERYGEAFVQSVDELYIRRHKEINKEWSEKEYEVKIKELQEEIKALDEKDLPATEAV